MFLYKNGLNPVVSFPGQGNVVWGQKVLLDKASSFDRINVRGLFFLKLINNIIITYQKGGIFMKSKILENISKGGYIKKTF